MKSNDDCGHCHLTLRCKNFNQPIDINVPCFEQKEDVDKKFRIIIKVDTNDADFNMSENVITEQELELIRPLCEAIKNFEPYVGSKPDYWSSKHTSNYPVQECCREDLGELTPQEIYKHIDKKVFNVFDNLTPYCEYGFHTIESVTIYPYVEGEELI